jgi:hypothetical protein
MLIIPLGKINTRKIFRLPLLVYSYGVIKSHKRAGSIFYIYGFLNSSPSIFLKSFSWQVKTTGSLFPRLIVNIKG